MLHTIIDSFKNWIPCDWEPAADQLEALRGLIEFSNNHGYTVRTNYEEAFIEAVNQKLALNTTVYQAVLDAAFADGIRLNYVSKSSIRLLLDRGDPHAFATYLGQIAADSEKMLAAFQPVTKTQTLEALRRVVKTDDKYLQVIHSIFSRYCFHLFDEACSAVYFSKDSCYTPDYFDYIDHLYPDMCRRDRALVYLDVSPQLFDNSYQDGCNIVLEAVKDAYLTLNNHCDLAILIPPLRQSGRDIQWELYCDLVLYAEKCQKGPIDRTYFRWRKIAQTTAAYISGLDLEKADFENAFQGFVYKDCFVLGKGEETADYALLLIFEKNLRDERPINCPACRSSHIQGNSYPILNVRSWECENPLCPDRSKYNRGKRYAFASLLRQRLMQDESNMIPSSFIAQWHLDCIHAVSQEAAFEMCLRHYSCVGDGVVIYTNRPESFETSPAPGRTLNRLPFASQPQNLRTPFLDSAYFSRYIVKREREKAEFPQCRVECARIFCGDAFHVLGTLQDNSIAGAVTSPPYYNAKAYSQWENIYCYLYDMYNIAREVFRVLKPGGVYLFNIFDYFDNEKNIVLSDMGNKRMILGAYMLDIFRRIGFTICGNIIWDKGEIQGNRGFNQGNLTPYYQAPLNCWEHIFILSKGTPDPKFASIKSGIRSIHPVIKMVHGRNVLGHDAPYPREIPEILIRHMDPADTVLDPFLGSGTTAIVANQYGVQSIGIEKNAEYYALSQRLIQAALSEQLHLWE